MITERYQFILYINGILLVVLAGTMTIPALVDFSANNDDGWVFVASAMITLFFGGLLILGNRQEPSEVSGKFIFLFTVTAWFLVTLFGALPLWLSSLQLSFTDAFFETMSGITTTGASVLSGLDNMPPGILIWRSLLNWFGGIGIVAMGMILLPALRVGGMQLFKSESSISEKTMPRAFQLVVATAITYFLLTLLCAICLTAAGMGGFDAVNHAMAALATGGFSTKDASVGYFDSPAIEFVLIIFMTAGALPLIYFVQIALRRNIETFRNEQVKGFFLVLGVAILAMTVWNVLANETPFLTSLRHSAFSVTSILTDTGFVTADFSTWGSFAIGLIFVLYFIGGCAGSTAGGIKIFRWQILMRACANQLKSTSSPSRVVLLKYEGRTVDAAMIDSVRNFFFLYLLTFTVLSLAVMMTGLDFISSTSAVAESMANAGPGIGSVVGPATNFGSIPTEAKWILSLAMLFGRLELVTIYVLFMPDTWR